MVFYLLKTALWEGLETEKSFGTSQFKSYYFTRLLGGGLLWQYPPEHVNLFSFSLFKLNI
jgi:hypothetical protein